MGSVVGEVKGATLRQRADVRNRIAASSRASSTPNASGRGTDKKQTNPITQAIG